MRRVFKSETRRLTTSPKCFFFSSGTTRSGEPGASSSLTVDPSKEWYLARLQGAVESGKMSRQAFAYFAKNMDVNPDVTRSRHALYQAVGNQDTSKMTKYQRDVLSDKLQREASAMVSNRLQGVLKEQEGQAAFMKEGTPTGESYWFEEETLTAGSIPAFVRDDIYENIKRSRRADSPAFASPPSAAPEEGVCNDKEDSGQAKEDPVKHQGTRSSGDVFS